MTLWIAYATTGKELEAEEAIKAMGSEWTSTYLRRAGRRSVGSVRSAIAGWNGERLAAGRDVAALPEHVRQWAIGVMSGLPK